MKKKLLTNLLRVVVSLGLIVLLFWLMRGSLGDVLSTIKKANMLLVSLSFLFLALGVTLAGIRLRAIMGAQDLKLTIPEAVYLVFIGCFFNNFLPTSMGGDIVKAYYTSKKTGRKLPSIACILLDRMLGSLTLILMLLVTSLFIKGAFLNKAIAMFILIAVFASLIIIAIFFSKKAAKKISAAIPLLKLLNLEDKTKSVYELIHNYKRHPKLLLRALFLSVTLQVITFYGVFLMTKSLNFSVPLSMVFLLMPIICTMSMAPSVNGLGVAEGAFVVFFGPLIGKSGAFALGILYRGLNFTTSLIGGIFYLFTDHDKISIREAEKYDR